MLCLKLKIALNGQLLMNRICYCLLSVAVITGLWSPLCFAADGITTKEARRALRKAAGFFGSQVACRGGYLWQYSGDLKLREGEGKATETMVWVQPPGTPSVGQAFLDAYEVTQEKYYLSAARNAAGVLLSGQLRTGGWYYHIEFDPEKRLSYGYRDVPEKRRQNTKSTLDDDTTQSAVRFLMYLDKTQQFEDERIHEAVVYALERILGVQFPNGGWYQWWDRYPRPVSEADFPVLKASYPKSWPHKWLNDWTGRYFINDNLIANMIITMLDAYEIYGDEKYLASALKAGDFILLSQMPEPQPAWAQQYDPNMHPVWDRKFEPPAISGLESQAVLESLMLLYARTGEKKYLEPVPRAITYLRRSQFDDGSLARFYELQTNRPLYFTKDYKLTYDSADVPTHYSFIVPSRLDEIEKKYEALLKNDTGRQAQNSDNPGDLAAAARKVIDSMDERGAWIEHRPLKAHKTEPPSGIIDCRTFIKNVEVLCRFLAARK